MVTLLPEKLQWVRRAAIDAGFGLLVFVIALYIWFPYNRAKELAISMAAAEDLDVEIGSAGPALFGVAFKDIRVSTRPLTGKPTRFLIDSARVKVSPFALLGGSAALSGISLEAFGGQIDIEQTGKPGGKKPFSVEIHARDVNLKELPVMGLPLAGTFKLDVDIESDTGRYADAAGAVSFACAACVVGDGKTPLKIEGNPFLAGGLTLPRFRMGDVAGRADIQKGVAKLKGVESKSPDGEIGLEGEITLRDPVTLSLLNLYLRFKLTEPFLKSAETVRTVLQMAASAGKRPDGGYGVRLGGTLGRIGPPVFSPTSLTGGSGVPTMPRPIQRPLGSTPGNVPAIAPSMPQPEAAPPPPPMPEAAPPPPMPEAAPPPPPPPPPPPVPTMPEPVPMQPEGNPQQLRGTPVGPSQHPEGHAPAVPAPSAPPPPGPVPGADESPPTAE